MVPGVAQRNLVVVEGAGIAGQVLHRELFLKNIPTSLADKQSFPRDKVCGGILQPDSWKYLNSIFEIRDPAISVRHIAHFWRGRRISRIALPEPVYFIPRLVLDHALYAQAKSGQTAPAAEPLKIRASGASGKGEWIGFQARTAPVEDLEMHYGRGIYMGVSPRLEGESHAAFIVKKSFVAGKAGMAELVKKELKVELRDPIKGTGQIHYGRHEDPLAVGDAKLTTHPFLGLGMKHAIRSAKLLSELIAEGREAEFERAHRKTFRKFHVVSRLASALYDSPARILLWPVLRYPVLFNPLYRWLHA